MKVNTPPPPHPTPSPMTYHITSMPTQNPSRNMLPTVSAWHQRSRFCLESTWTLIHLPTQQDSPACQAANAQEGSWNSRTRWAKLLRAILKICQNLDLTWSLASIAGRHQSPELARPPPVIGPRYRHPPARGLESFRVGPPSPLSRMPSCLTAQSRSGFGGGQRRGVTWGPNWCPAVRYHDFFPGTKLSPSTTQPHPTP